MVYIDTEERKNYFAEVELYFLKKNKLFKAFLQYFEDNWLQNIFIDFKGLDIDALTERTNSVP